MRLATSRLISIRSLGAAALVGALGLALAASTAQTATAAGYSSTEVIFDTITGNTPTGSVTATSTNWQAAQFLTQLGFEPGRGGRAILAVDGARQAHHAVDRRQRAVAKQLARDALDRVAGRRARRETLGHNDAQPRMRQLIVSGVQHKMRCFLRRAQTKNG
jgi:hypothetical protein